MLVPRAGLEPATLGLEVLCSIQLSYQGVALTKMVRVRRVELRSPVWKTGIITAIRHPHILTRFSITDWVYGVKEKRIAIVVMRKLQFYHHYLLYQSWKTSICAPSELRRAARSS